jgi:hypothetical protein
MVLQNKFNCKVTKKVHIKFDRQKLQLHILSMPITISFMKQLYCKQLVFLKFIILQFSQVYHFLLNSIKIDQSFLGRSSSVIRSSVSVIARA